ncbi:hypothetical protein QPK87_30350 [Kamptonema cortianum]|nr:hypothetical protein [Kamptonema cortianum]
MAHPLHGKWREVNPRNLPRLEMGGVSVNNLRGIDFSIPAGRLTVITGVSGSGKSTAMRGALIPAVREALQKRAGKAQAPLWKIAHADIFDAVFEVDQSPIGKTPRSTPATYVGFMDTIRQLFPVCRWRGCAATRIPVSATTAKADAARPAKAPGSSKCKCNSSPRPMCIAPPATGKGSMPKPSTFFTMANPSPMCWTCPSRRPPRFFAAVPQIARPLNLLMETGLGYLKLGQQSPTLSGGEAQRLKLVTELARRDLDNLRGPRRAFKPNLYCLEEPTIGLHMADVKRLIEVIHRLVDAGHSIVVIEHHLDLIAEADWIIDIGPEGGSGGGKIVYEGDIPGLLKNKKSHTARYLKAHLKA